MKTYNFTLKDGQPLGDLVGPLLSWYDTHKRVLPWRENTEAYRVWISEIMLQQTRVDTVIPYYNRFLEELPDITALANAPEEQLLKLWEGLGYYSRVRNLQRAAQQILERHGGIFPQNFSDVRALTGIGDYTAGAICSIAFEQPTSAVDGNVLRVISRLTKNAYDSKDAAVKKAVEAALREIYPEKNRGDFTQALMELGALICAPNGQPLCDECPLKDLCGAKDSNPLDYPKPIEKAVRKKVKLTVFKLCHGDYFAVQKRKENGLLAGLYELPNCEGHKSDDEIAAWLKEKGIVGRVAPKPTSKKHIFSHIEWHMRCHTVWCEELHPDFTWVTPQESTLPTAFRKLI